MVIIFFNEYVILKIKIITEDKARII